MIQAPNLGQNLQNVNKLIETRSAPVLLGATHRAFTFYLGNPLFSILSIRFILSKSEQRNKQTAVRVTHLGEKAVKVNRPYQLTRSRGPRITAAGGRLRMETDRQKVPE